MRRAGIVLAGAAGALAVATAGTAGVQALITGAQIKDGTIQSRDIANGTIGRADIADAAEAALRGARGPSGVAGPAGPAGPAGVQGAAGPQGPQGPGGAQGPQGPKGDTGAGLNVTGSVAAAGDLPAGATLGDAYIVTDTGHLHVWTGAGWIDAGPVRGPVGPQGATGATGPAGPAGPQGPAGAAGGLAGYQVVTGAPQPIAASDFEVETTASCPAGKVVLGGGANVADPLEEVLVVASRPTVSGAVYGWSVTLLNYGGDNTLTPYAICASSA